MSQSQSHVTESRHSSESSPSPFRRDSWWGDDDETEEESETHDNEYNHRLYKARFFAHTIHKKAARGLDPITLFQPPDRGELFDVPAPQARTLLRFLDSGQDIESFPWPDEYPEHDPLALHRENAPVELTDPEIYVPVDGIDGDELLRTGQKYHKWRHNEDHGHITGPYLDDVSAEKFEEEVEIVLEYAVEDKGILEGQAEELKRDAMRMKRSQDLSDLDVLTKVLDEIYAATE